MKYDEIKNDMRVVINKCMPGAMPESLYLWQSSRIDPCVTEHMVQIKEKKLVGRVISKLLKYGCLKCKRVEVRFENLGVWYFSPAWLSKAPKKGR